MKGTFVALEGVEGAGKSVAILALSSMIEALGYEVVLTREPGGTEVSETIRNLLLGSDFDLSNDTELLLFFAARTQHVADVIRPALEAGKVVLCDRYIGSSVALQGYGREMGAERIYALAEWANDFITPDYTFYLDCPVEVGVSRMKGDPDRMERAGTEFHQRVRDGFLAQADNDATWLTVDASRSIEEVHERLQKLVLDTLDMSWYVTGDHPTLGRPDTYGMSRYQAIAYADMLEGQGFENIEWGQKSKNVEQRRA